MRTPDQAVAAGVSRQTVRAHLDTILEFGIVTAVAGGKRSQFTLDSTVTAVGADHVDIDPKTGEVRTATE